MTVQAVTSSSMADPNNTVGLESLDLGDVIGPDGRSYPLLATTPAGFLSGPVAAPVTSDPGIGASGSPGAPTTSTPGSGTTTGSSLPTGNVASSFLSSVFSQLFPNSQNLGRNTLITIVAVLLGLIALTIVLVRITQN